MTDETGAPASGNEPVAAAPAELPEEMSAEEAGRLWAERLNQPNSPAPAPEKAAVEPVKPSAEKADANPETDPGEEPEAIEPADEQPPIEPPRSWTKEAKERWSSLPRDTQEYLAQREQERDRGLRQSQNEVAEQRKAVEAERAKAEQARTEYEGKLKGVVEQLTEVNNTQFGAIKSQADLDFLINEVSRLAQAGQIAESQQVQAYLTAWQAHQNKLVARTQELRQIEEQNAQKTASEWAKFAEEENTKFLESLSEADKSKLEGRLKAAPDFLEERGFTKQELNDLWNGKSRISLRDHRLQALILDGLKLREIQSAPAKAVRAEIPPVQKPGVSSSAADSASARIQALQKQFNANPTIENATALRLARARRSA